MKKTPDANEIERFLHNCTWVRRLACRLLYDKSLTDDVLQEVYLALVQAPPSRPQALRAWMGTVVRRLTSRVNYTERRRQDFQRSLPDSGAVDAMPSAEQIATRLETQGQLARAVSQLSDPHRAVVYLHFFEGLRLSEVAERLGTPPSTVRTQLSRALQRLRGTLARESGGRSKLAALLLPLILPDDLYAQGLLATTLGDNDPAGRAGSGGDGHGSLPLDLAPRVPRGVVAAVGVLTLLVSSIGYVVFRAPAPSLPDVQGPTDANVQIEVSTRAGAVEFVPAAAVLTSAVTSIPEPTAAPTASSPRSNLRVIDAKTGAPVATAAIYSVRRTRQIAKRAGTSDANGWAHVAPEVLGRDGLVVLAAGYVEKRERARLRAGIASAHVVELQPCFTTTLRVLLPDGAPATGVDVTVRPHLRGLENPEPLSLVTDIHGETNYPFGYEQTSIEIDTGGYATIAIGATTPLQTIHLVPGRRVLGRIRDSRGAPIAACRARITSTRRTQSTDTRSDSRGEFALGNVAFGEELTVRLYAAHFPAYREIGEAPEGGVWDFVLPDGMVVDGAVAGPDGTPAEGAFAFLMLAETSEPPSGKGTVSGLNTAGLPPRSRGDRRLVPLARARVAVDGTFAIGPVGIPEGGAYLFVHHSRWANSLEWIPDFTSVASRQRGERQLSTGGTLSGRLLSPLGEPIAGAMLHVGEVWSNGVEGIVSRARTAADGRFTLRGLPDVREELLPRDTHHAKQSRSHPVEVEDVNRALVFLTAFAPDELLGLSYPGTEGELSVEESGVEGGFALEDAIEAGEELLLVGAKHDSNVPLDVPLQVADGSPVRTWTRAIVFRADGQVESGVLGAHLSNPRFFSSTNLAVPFEGSSRVLLTPRDYRWRQFDLSESEGLPPPVELVPWVPSLARLHFQYPDGTPVPTRGISVEVPFGESSPIGVVSVGSTDAAGDLDLSFLPSGRHFLRLAPRRDVAPKEVGIFTSMADLGAGNPRAAFSFNEDHGRRVLTVERGTSGETP